MLIYRWLIDTGDQDPSDEIADAAASGATGASATDGAVSVDTDEPVPSGRRYRRIEYIAVGSCVVAVAVAAVVAALHRWVPVSDEALIELRVRDVPAHLPLVGVWSRFGWNHPGPALFYYLSPFYLVGGRSSSALAVGMVVLQGSCVLGAWALVRRIHPPAALGFLVAGLVLLVTSEPWSIRNPWNPYVAIGGGLLLFAAAWSFGVRHRSGAVLLLPLGSFLVQVHAVMAPMVLVTGVFAMVVFLSDRERPVPGRALVAGSLITLLVWLPPIVEQLANTPGNLRSMVTASGTGQTVGVINTVKVAFAQLAPLPGAMSPGVIRQRFLPLQGWSFPLWGLVFVAAILLVLGSRDRTAGRALFIATGMALGAHLGVMTLRDGPYSYLAIGSRVSVLVMITLAVVVIVEALPRPVPALARSVMGVAGVALSVVLVTTQVSARDPLRAYGTVVDGFVEDVIADAPPRVIEVESTPPSLHTMIMAPGMVLALEKKGYDVRSPMLGDSLVGAHRGRGGGDYVVKIAVPGHLDDLVADGWKVLAVHQPFDESELSMIDRLNIEMLDHPPGVIGSITSGERPRLERELAAVEQGRPAVALVVRRAGASGD